MTAAAAVKAFLKKEPAILMSAAGAAISVGTTFGLKLNLAQTREIYGAVAAVTALGIRQTVTPNVKVAQTDALVAQAEKVQARLSAIEAAVSELGVPSLGTVLGGALPTISK